MGLFSFFNDPSNSSARRKIRSSRSHRHAVLGFDTLESRLTPAGNTISGYVYADANNNGFFDPGETPIPNTTVTLKNSSNQVVATAITDATGLYVFSQDQTISNTPKTITQTVNFGPTDTNFDLTGTINKFDPNLGNLTEVDIMHDGNIVSSIKVENTSKSSGTNIVAAVSGTLTLTAPGVNDNLNVSQIVGNFTAGKFDNSFDFGGTSGNDFGSKTAAGSHSLALTNGLGPWMGAGQVTIEEVASASSNASGGGNVATIIASTGSANITVVYRYVPNNNLKPGNYIIVETQPSPYIDGLDAINNVPVPGSNKTDTLQVTLNGSDLVKNNFGELLPSVLSGHVFYDANGNGVREPNEAGIGSVSVTLTGTNDLGPVSIPGTTDANGFYQFTNLRPGNYIVTETQPGGYKDGLDSVGTINNFVVGTLGNDVLSNISLPMGTTGVNYDFGELDPSNADLGIVKSATPSPVAINGTLTYTLVVTNYGTYTAQQVQVVDTLPNGVTLLNASGFGWSVSTIGSVITATTPSLAVGATSTITIIVKVPGISDTVTNTATVSAKTPDSNPLNNTSTVVTPVILPDPPINSLADPPILPQPPRGKRGVLTGVSANFGQQGLIQDVAFADAVYQTLLGRHADITTLQVVSSGLTQGTLSRASLIQSVMNTDEYRGIVAAGVYQAVLHRDPTGLERQAAVNSLKLGATTQSLSTQLYLSAEFQSMNLNTSVLVGSLYVGITGKLPSSATSTATVQALGATPISQLVQSLANSPDAATATINAVFRTVLRRNATATELATYVPQFLAQVLNDQTLTAALLTTTEFRTLAKAV